MRAEASFIAELLLIGRVSISAAGKKKSNASY